MHIHLAIAFDQNYLAPFYALITSVFNNNASHSFEIHAIVSGVEEQEKIKIQQYVAGHRSKLHFYTIDQHVVSSFVLTHKWTSAVYYRLYFPLLIPSQIERLLYLDTDTLVLSDLAELYQTDLENQALGAVYDNWVQTAPHLGIYEKEKYFNSGVLLIDVPRWKKEKVSEQAFEFLQTQPEKIKFVDQDALNAVLKHQWKRLPDRYNFMFSLIPEGISRAALTELIKDKVVLHYTLTRPWQLLCKNRYRGLYRAYLKQSPYSGSNSSVVDFSWNKLPAYFKIRCVEFYHDMPAIQKIWRKLKRSA